MKFYKDKKIYDCYFWNKITDNYLTCIYYDVDSIIFYKNGFFHNNKNAAYIRFDGYKGFYLNNKCYGNENDFTKKSWRRFVKLQIFK